MRTILFTTVTFLLIFSTSSFAQKSNTSVGITINVTNIQSNKGNIRIGLYKSEQDFLKKIHKSISTKASEDGVQVTFKNLEPGEYAISLYHDKDNNNKLNTFLKIPTEPYGVSNNKKERFGPPQWKNARFTLSNEIITQNIRL